MTLLEFRKAGIKFAMLAMLSVLLLSCESVQYYSQAARGQMQILFGRQEIEDLLGRSDISNDLKAKLETVLAIRQFAEQELALPVNDNYKTYVDVQRDHVVWNVFAAEEFSTQAMEWCYPIAGCVTYRGYFSEAAAQRYADRLEDQGYDVYTGGVDAYSTLGWFDDSLLSTVTNRSDPQLAGLIFHELAHQVLYLPGDTTFNESFATAVEREGVRRWLNYIDKEELFEDASLGLQRQQEFATLIIEWRDKFADLYQQDISESQMRVEKSRLQDQLRLAYGELQQHWGGYAGYDNWFSQSLNNAQLSTVGSYNDLVPEFTRLLERNDGDFSAFYESVEGLMQLSEDERITELSRRD